MRSELQKRYIPTIYKHDLSERIYSRTQGSVAEYLEELHTLSNRVDMDEPEYIIVGRLQERIQQTDKGYHASVTHSYH